MKTPDLDEDWRAIGHTPRKRPVEPDPVVPDTETARAWFASLGTSHHTYLTVPGASPQARASFYRNLDHLCLADYQHTRTWLLRGPLTDWTDRLRRLPILDECWDHLPGRSAAPTFWRWLWALGQTEDFVLDEPLRSMVDRPYHLIHDALRLLMGLRFLSWEQAPDGQFAAMLHLMVRWMTMDAEPFSQAESRVLDELGVRRTPGSTDERLDLLILFLALAEQNGIIGKVAFVFDDIEAACTNENRPLLRELHQMMQATARWAKFIEIPVALLLGFDPRRAPLLRRTNPKLASDVLAAMTWASV